MAIPLKTVTSRHIVAVIAGSCFLAALIAYIAYGRFYEFGPARLQVPAHYLAAYYPPDSADGSAGLAFHITLNGFKPPDSPAQNSALAADDFTILALLTYKADLPTDQPLLSLLKKYIDPTKPPHAEGRYMVYPLADSQYGHSLYIATNGAYPAFFTCRHPLSDRDRDWPMTCEVTESLGSGDAAKLPNGRSKVVLTYYLPKPQAPQLPEIDARLRALIGGFEQQSGGEL